MFDWIFSKTYKHKCADGSTKIIHRNVDDAFPLFIPGVDLKLDSNLKGLKGVNAKVAAEYKDKIQGLLYDLDELNKSLMMTFRSVYITYQTDPCSNNGFLLRQVEIIIHDQSRLNRLRIQTKTLISLASYDSNNRADIIKLYKDIVNQLGGKSITEVARIEIKENRDAVKKWKGENEG